MRTLEMKLPVLERRNRGVTVLLVEDDDFFADLVVETLKHDKRVGDVWRYSDGAEALEHLASHEWPDLIITDISMPKVCGVDFLQSIRKAEREGLAWKVGAFSTAQSAVTPVVVLTNSDKAVDFSSVVMNFGNCFVTKPDEPKDLRVLMRALVRSVIWSRPLPSILTVAEAESAQIDALPPGAMMAC